MHLARKITLPLAVAAFLALGFSAWLSVQEAVALHHADIERQQSIAGRVFLAALEREREHGTVEEGAPILLRAANTDARTQMRVIPRSQLSLTPQQVEQLGRGEAVFDLDVWHSAETWLPTTLSDGTPGALWVQESLDSERTVVRRIVWSHVLNFGTLGLLWAGVAIGLGAVVVGRPMRALAEKARRVSKGDYSGPVQLTQADEIGQLAAEMNHMCDELLASQERIRQEVEARAKAQDALRHADRLTTVGVLAAGIAHELGTPLNVVSMRAKMIATGEVTGDEAKSNGEIIHQQSANMTRIIRQLLDFARRQPPRLTRFPLEQVVSQSLSMLDPLAEKNKATLTFQPGDRVEIEGDPNQLHQVITNLVMNGVQAMAPKGGQVLLRLQSVRATPPPDMGGPEGAYVRLDVKDEGSGIPPEVLPRIFEPFFTTKPVGDGNGLGLPVAWGIVKDHRGWIAVETAPGAGTTFSLYLPLPPETHAS